MAETLALPRHAPRGLAVAVDLAVLVAAFVAAAVLLHGPDPRALAPAAVVAALQYALLSVWDVPRVAWRHVELADVLRILRAVAAAGLLLLSLLVVVTAAGVRLPVSPGPLVVVDALLAVLGVAGVRVLRRAGVERRARAVRRDGPARRTLLIGAGSAGALAARAIAHDPRLGVTLVGFVDDDPHKLGARVAGIPVLGATTDLPELVARHAVDELVLSVAAASGPALRDLVRRCERVQLPLRIIPGVHELLDGRVHVSRIREVTVEDLLGRPAVDLDLAAIRRLLTGKCVLITGAGGSIGSELCRQVAAFAPARLVLVEQAENSLFYAHLELQRDHPALPIELIVADVADAARIDQTFAAHRPHVVFHAAARKHVPMMELSPGEAVRTNVFGTRAVAEAAARAGAAAFVMISTDKAVNPTSVMGATKRVAELLVQGLSRRSATRFITVRFGNVLGSAGSVIPTFRGQIARGGPVTVTHPEMRRYFMTIPEACKLVMQAATQGEGGEIFVLDMGDPVRIVDLARDLIRRSGFADDEIPIVFTGLRPGEKLFEELSTSEEHMTRTRHPKIFVGKIAPPGPDADARAVQELAGVPTGASVTEVRAALARLIPEMQDWQR